MTREEVDEILAKAEDREAAILDLLTSWGLENPPPNETTLYLLRLYMQT